MHLNVGGGGGLRDVEANERQRQQFIVDGDGWVLLSMSDNEVGVVVAWPLVVGVAVEDKFL